MARGGYGLLRLLPFIDTARCVQPAAPDRRLLRRHGAAGAGGARRRRLDSRPGRHAARAAWASDDQRALFARLETPGPGLLLDGLEGLIPGRVQGPLLGGNLEMFSRLLGTPYLPDLAGAILFFEDLGERPYRDRSADHASGPGGRVRRGQRGRGRATSRAAASPSRRAPSRRRPTRCWSSGSGACRSRSRRAARSATARATARSPTATLCELDTTTGTLTALEGAVS